MNICLTTIIWSKIIDARFGVFAGGNKIFLFVVIIYFFLEPHNFQVVIKKSYIYTSVAKPFRRQVYSTAAILKMALLDAV